LTRFFLVTSRWTTTIQLLLVLGSLIVAASTMFKDFKILILVVFCGTLLIHARILVLLVEGALVGGLIRL